MTLKSLRFSFYPFSWSRPKRVDYFDFVWMGAGPFTISWHKGTSYDH